MCSHVPNKGEQMVRYYGFYSNVSRGRRKQEDRDELIPCILEPDKNSKKYRKNWARLIQKIYELDPLCCPKCQGRMRILAFIDIDVIEGNLKISVEDNGSGFDTERLKKANQEKGWGLLTMSERARAVGGKCRVESAPGLGTSVIVEVPL